MFVNYLEEDKTTVRTLKAVRIVLGIWILWKIASYDWPGIAEIPYSAYSELASPILPHITHQIVGYEYVLGLILVALFTIGYRPKWTGIAAGFLMLHLSTAIPGIAGLLIIELLGLSIILFSLGMETQEKKNTPDEPQPTSRPLLYLQALIGITYFLTALNRAIIGNIISWVTPGNMAGVLNLTVVWTNSTMTPIGTFLLQLPWLSSAILAAVLIIEFFYLPLLALGFSATPIVAAAILMHVGIGLTTGHHFFFTFLLLNFLFIDPEKISTIIPAAMKDNKHVNSPASN